MPTRITSCLQTGIIRRPVSASSLLRRCAHWVIIKYMKLYEIPRGSKIICEVWSDDGVISDSVIYHKPDGAYSVCTFTNNKNGNEGLVHLSMNTELKEVDGVYHIES